MTEGSRVEIGEDQERLIMIDKGVMINLVRIPN